MFERKVLDKGFIRLLNISGAVRRTFTTPEDWSDLSNESADATVDSSCFRDFDASDIDPALVARTSFAKGMEEHTQLQDEQLVDYLIRNNHTTPLEFTTVILEFKMPIFVARQVMRHRTASINEVSGRYVTLPDDWYIPDVVRGKHSGGNKQGSEDNLPENEQIWFKDMLDADCQQSYNLYEECIESGICPEQARMFLHLNHYTQFVWKQDLHNLMHFLSLRLDEHAQWEVRQYAEAIYELLKEHLPKSMYWFDQYRRKLDNVEKELLENLTKTKKLSEEEITLITKLAGRNGIKIKLGVA